MTGTAQVKVTSRGNALSFGLQFIDGYTKRDDQWQIGGVAINRCARFPMAGALQRDIALHGGRWTYA